MDGSISTPRVQSAHVTREILSSEARDEEAARAVPVRQGEQELGPPWVREIRPLLAERLSLEPQRVDDRLVLLGIDRAGGIDDRAPAPHPFRRRSEQRELELRQRLGAPAKIGPRGEDAEARAGRIDERAVEAVQLGRKLERVGAEDVDVAGAEPRAVLLELPR